MSRRSLLLGIDCGLTVTKAVVFADDGAELASASSRTDHVSPRPRWVERDMATVWREAAQVVRRALSDAGVGGEDVAAVGVTGHGDGLYLVDAAGEPVRPAVLSMDSRATDLLAERSSTGLLKQALRLTGQVPFPGSTAAVAAWMGEHEPESLERAAHLIGCKDWVKLKLTGVVSTDPTEASSAFADVRTQAYSREALALYSLDELWDRLAPVVGSTTVAGTVSPEAAAETGLRAGTPVASGLHDVDAGLIGTGAQVPGTLSIIAGSFSINQTVSRRPIIDERWLTRTFVEPGTWLHLSVSPASASNLEWFARQLWPAGSTPADREALFKSIEQSVSDAAGRPRGVWYLPFLYGSPIDNRASAAFVGLRGWHDRGDLARALFEGVVFNHVWHIEALASTFPLESARLCGGGSRSNVWGQMFADATGLPVSTTESEESGALGAAMCAGVAVARYGSIDEAVQALVHVRHVFEPDPLRFHEYAEAMERYRLLAASLGPFWAAAAEGAVKPLASDL